VRTAYWIHVAVQCLAVGSVVFYLAHLEQRFRFELGGVPLPLIVVWAFRFHHALWLFPIVAFLFATQASRCAEVSAGRFAVFGAVSFFVLVALAALAMLVSVAPFIYPITILNR